MGDEEKFEKGKSYIEGKEVLSTKEEKVPVDKPLIEPEAKKKKKRKKPKKTLELSDIKIPLALLVMSITDSIGGKWVATDKELKDIEDGFNLWVEYRFAVLQKLAPELVLVVPIINYLRPRMMQRKEIKTIQDRTLKVEEIPKDKAKKDALKDLKD